MAQCSVVHGVSGGSVVGIVVVDDVLDVVLDVVAFLVVVVALVVLGGGVSCRVLKKAKYTMKPISKAITMPRSV